MYQKKLASVFLLVLLGSADAVQPFAEHLDPAAQKVKVGRREGVRSEECLREGDAQALKVHQGSCDVSRGGLCMRRFFTDAFKAAVHDVAQRKLPARDEVTEEVITDQPSPVDECGGGAALPATTATAHSGDDAALPAMPATLSGIWPLSSDEAEEDDAFLAESRKRFGGVKRRDSFQKLKKKKDKKKRGVGNRVLPSFEARYGRAPLTLSQRSMLFRKTENELWKTMDEQEKMIIVLRDHAHHDLMESWKAGINSSSGSKYHSFVHKHWIRSHNYPDPDDDKRFGMVSRVRKFYFGEKYEERSEELPTDKGGYSCIVTGELSHDEKFGADAGTKVALKIFSKPSDEKVYFAKRRGKSSFESKEEQMDKLVLSYTREKQMFEKIHPLRHKKGSEFIVKAFFLDDKSLMPPGPVIPLEFMPKDLLNKI